MVLLPRASVLTLIPGTLLGKQECLGKTLDTIKQAAIRVARRSPDSVTFKKPSMSAQLLTPTCIEIEDSLRGSCCLERHRHTSRFVKILILLSAVSKLWTRLQSSVSERRKSRRKRPSKRSCHFENVAKKFIKPDFGGIGQQVNGAGTGDLANTRVPE